MRPLTLRIEGLRSYRHVQEIDFTNFSLVAIVGDTGAGKSSILEALTVALYGSSTWSGRELKALISDSAPALQVELTFRAERKTWRVTRMTARGTSPAPMHLLECLDDPRVPQRAGAKEVNREIERLVGLSHEAFTRVVVLPQGRFQRLLQASPSERTGILKGIFHLERLEDVRGRAAALFERLQPTLLEHRQARAALLVDPPAAAVEARARLAAADARVRDIQALQRALASRRAQLERAVTRGRALDDAAARLASARMPDVRQRTADLEARAAATELQLRASAEALDGVTAAARALEDALAAAERAGESGVACAGALATLEPLRSELPVHADERAVLAAEAAALDDEERALAALVDDTARIAAVAGDAAALHRAALAAVERARALRDDVERTALLLERAAQERAAAEAVRAARAHALTESARALEQATSSSEVLEQARAQAAAAHRSALREHAAHHAATDTAPGDPCPVCDRALPPGFAPPPAPALDAATRALDAAEVAARDAAAARSRAAGERALHGRALQEAEAAAAARSRAVDDARVALAHLERTAWGEAPQTTDPARAAIDAEASAAREAAGDVAALRARASAQLAAATRAADAALAKAEAARRAAEQGDAAVSSRRDAAARRRAALAAARAAHERTARGWASRIAALPPRLRPASLALDDVERALAATTALARSRAHDAAALEALRREQEARAAERAAIERVARRDVEEPLHALGRGAFRLAARLDDALGLLERRRTATDEPAGLAAQCAYAVQLDVEAGDALAALAAARAVEADDEAEARAELSASAPGLELVDDAALARALHEASADAGVAARDLDRAHDEAPRAAALDAAIARTAPVVDAAEEIARLMSDGRFVGHVVTRKQRVLLAVASDILSDVTGGRFGFAEDFLVVDRASGQARDAMTLSGGETFLASLALALGLVELAGRSGGRLEALFLDEGFGSLDANTLGDALDVLAQQAQGGRMVAVISHLRAVAEAFDDVLVVTKGLHGSEVRTLRGDERDAWGDDEASAGLL